MGNRNLFIFNSKGPLFFFLLTTCSALVFIASVAILHEYLLSRPKYSLWNSDQINKKINLLQDPQNPYDTVIIGSSRVKWHVIPQRFDQGAGTNSIILAEGGMFCPESFHLAENILLDDSINLSNIIVELRPIAKLERVTTKGLYWLSFDEAAFLFSCLWSDSLSTLEKLEYQRNYITSIMRKYLGLGIGLNYFQYFFSGGNSSKMIAEKALAWRSLDQHQKIDPAAKKKHLEFIQSDHDYLSKLKKYQKTYPQLKFFNAAYYSRLRELIKIAEKKGVNIFFILQPLSDNSRILNAAKKLGDEYLIDLSFHGPSYDPVNYFDDVHYNENGARLYTSALASVFSRKRERQM